MNSMSLSGTPRRKRHGGPVAGAGVGVRRDPEDPARRRRSRARPPCRAIAFNPPCRRSQAITPWQRPRVLDELPGEVLLVHRDPALDELLVEHLDQDVPGDVGGEHRAGRPGRAERPLGEPAVVGAGEHRAPVLELVDVGRRLAREDLDRVLVAEEVGALDRVVGMGLGAVVAGVAECSVDAALGRAGVASRRMQLRDHRDVGARVERLDRRPHAGTAGADHEYVVRRLHVRDASGLPGRRAGR